MFTGGVKIVARLSMKSAKSKAAFPIVLIDAEQTGVYFKGKNDFAPITKTIESKTRTFIELNFNYYKIFNLRIGFNF